MAVVDFIVYSTIDGSATSRPVLRWGACDASAVSAQAGSGEATALKTISDLGDGVSIVWFYDPSTGNLSFTAVVVNADPAEERAKRNNLLAETDFTQFLDVPMTASLREEFVAYRQLLRDVPQQSGFPDTITWPTKPTYVKATSYTPPTLIKGTFS